MQVSTADEATLAGDGFQDSEHLDILMIHALLDALYTVFSTMVKLEIAPGVPIPKDDAKARGDVSGMMVMGADGVEGSVALSLSMEAVVKISTSLFGKAIEAPDDEAKDLVGELTNMLVGHAKAVTAEKGYDFDMRTPELFAGEGHELHHARSGKTVLLPVTLEETEFFLELNFG